MPARAPTLGSGSNPFGVQNYAFSLFDLGGSGLTPAQQALQDAGDARQSIGLRWSNGQATDSEYLAAINAEIAAANVIAGSTDPTVSGPAKKQIDSLNNLVHDVNVQIGETAARAQGDPALLAFWQQELTTMTPGSTAYVALANQIKNLADSVANQKDVDTQNAAAFAMQSAQSDWQAGTLSDDGYKAALKTYADSQKPGTTAWVNAHDTYTSTVYRLDRNAIVEDVNQGKKQLEDLVAYDRTHLDGISDKTSQAYRDALDAYQGSQSQLFSKLDTKTVNDFQNSHMTAAQALAWYKGQLVGQFADNPGVVEQINGRISDFKGRVQDAADQAMVDKWNAGTVSQSTFSAYAKTREAAYAPGTADYQKWAGFIDQAKDKVTSSQMTYAYGLSQKYVDLQKFIADNSKPPAGSTSTSQRTVLGPDGHWHVQSVTTAGTPTAAEQAAWQQRQVEVADAKNQLAALSHEIAGTPTGFVTATQIRDYYVGLQAKTVKGTPEWFNLQTSIDGYNDRIHYEATLSSSGIKVGYPGITTAGLAASGKATGGGGVSPQVTSAGLTAVPKGAAVAPANHSNISGSSGGHYTAAELDYAAIRLSQLTGLDPQVTRLWALKESGGANNPFGVSPGGHRESFATPEAGIQEAARWINSMSQFAGIKNSAGKTPAQQIAAIDSSPWGPGGFKGGYRGSFVSLANSQGLHAPANISLSSGQAPKPTDNGMTQGQFLAGLSQTESHGNYNSRNSKTGAFGKYQILPSNWKAWAKQYLGDANAAATPANQEKVVQGKTNDLYKWLGSWQAVAHWWLTGGSDASAHQDPTKWSATSTAYVNSVIGGGGGAVVMPKAPTAPTKGAAAPKGAAQVPTTGATTAAGKGVRSGLQAITSQTTTVPRPGATAITTTKTAGIDFPTNLDSAAFEKLYTQLVAAVNAGKTSFAYREGGQVVNILLPDNPGDRWQMVNDLDARHIDMLSTTEASLVGTSKAAAATAKTAAAIKQAGQNQLNLIDMNYGGTRTRTDPVTGKVVKEDRGERANPAAPALTPAQVAKLTPAARADYQNQGTLQTRSMTPLAAGVRVLDNAKTYIADQTKLMQQSRDAGNMDEAYAHWLNIHDVLTDTSSFVQQIGVYTAQAEAATTAINAQTGATPTAPQKAELARLKEALRSDGELAAAAAPADDYAGKEIKPFLKLDAHGNAVRAPGSGQLALGDGVIRIADATPTGGTKIDFVKAPVQGQTQHGPNYAPPNRVQANVPDGQGGITQAYAKWHVGQVGVIKAADGSMVPLEGRVLDVGGWVEDPFNPGRWSPSVIVYQADPRIKLTNVPITANGKPDGEPTGRYGLEFTPLVNGAPSPTDKYRFQFDPKTGQTNLIQEHIDPGTKKVTLINKGSAASGVGGAEVQGAGIGLDTGATGPEATKFLLSGGISGAFPGTDFSTAIGWAQHGRTTAFGQQVAGAAAAAAGGLARGGVLGLLGSLLTPKPNDYTSGTIGGHAGPVQPSSPNTLGAPPVPGSGWTNIGGAMPNPYWYGPPGAQPATPLTPVTITGGGGKFGPTIPRTVLTSVGVGAGVMPPIKSPTPVRAPTVIPARTPSVSVGVGAGATGPKQPAPSKAPVVTHPTTKPSVSVGVGAGATGAPVKSNKPNVQAVATLPKIAPPPVKQPTPKPAPPTVRTGNMDR